MEFEVTTSLNPILNEIIDRGIKDTLDQKTGSIHVFKPGAIYVHQDFKLIAGAIFEIQGTSLWIESLWVDTKFQRKEIGTQLIEKLMEIAHKDKCKSLQLNTYFAKSFFQKLGFEVIAIVPKWKYNLDCCYMRKVL